MKKKEFSKIALLGLASGLAMLSQNSLVGIEDHNSLNMEHLIAKATCKNLDGCGAPEPEETKEKTDKSADKTDKPATDKEEANKAADESKKK